jgi:hypothetical protein
MMLRDTLTPMMTTSIAVSHTTMYVVVWGFHSSISLELTTFLTNENALQIQPLNNS